jgi:hypothetical protein
MSLCLAAGAVSAVLAVEAFTLGWIHSIEKIRWEEDWRIEGHALVITEARIRGTGAGMEPPAGSVLKDGVWRYRPCCRRKQCCASPIRRIPPATNCVSPAVAGRLRITCRGWTITPSSTFPFAGNEAKHRPPPALRPHP